MKNKKDNGYVLLLAVLISSIILAMSMGIFSISLKEVSLATFARDSVKAFSASSRGLECAMFADRINRDVSYSAGEAKEYFASRGTIGDYTPFAEGDSVQIRENLNKTAFDDPWSATNRPKLECFGNSDIPVSATSSGPVSGTSTFQIGFPDGACADVTVEKSGIETTFVSNGFSDSCTSTNPRRTQRTISVRVNI